MAREDTTSQDLYDLLITQNLDPEITDEKGQPSQPTEGRVFTFDWTAESGKNYGTAVVLITDDGELQLFFGDNLGRGMEEPDKTEWYDFMQQLRRFAARNNFLTFAPKNLNRLKHAMAGMAAIKEGLFEGYYGTRKVSYMGEETDARLMIRHRKTLAETDRRHQHIESLFIETAEGERFKLPFTHLAGGRAMLEHVRQGGRPYDVRGVHITEMVDELKVLSRFNRASAGRVMEGITQQLVEQARTYYKNLRETLKHLSRSRGYQTYFESWTPLTETESESLVEDIKTLFIEQTLDARIEAALPVLAKIKETQMREADIFESYINRLAEGTWAVPDTPEAERKLQELMAQELPVGPDATNVTEQLYDVFGDDDLYDQLEALARENPDADARPLIQARLEEMGFDIGMNDEPDADQELDEDEDNSNIPGLTYDEIWGKGEPWVEELPFGKVLHKPPLRSPTDAKILFVKRLMEKYGLDERKATDIMKAVELEVAKGATWNWSVENQLGIFNVGDPFADEREKEERAREVRIRQAAINTLKNYYKQIRQEQGQERAQAIARLRQVWNQGTPEEQAEVDRYFGDDPQWKQIRSKLVMKPRFTQNARPSQNARPTGLGEQDSAPVRRRPQKGDIIQWQMMRDRSPQTGQVLDVKGLTVTVLPTGEQDQSRAMKLDLANKSLSYKIAQTPPPPAKPTTSPPWSDQLKDIRNAEGETRLEFRDKIQAAGGRLKFMSKGPHGPDAYELNGKEVRWQGVQKPMGHYVYVPPSAQTGAPESGMTEADDLSTFEGSGCNHTMEGESCPVHGLAECGMYEGEDYDRTASELNKARQSGDVDRVKELTGELLKRAGPQGFEVDIRGDARPMKEDALDRIKNLALAKTR